MAKSKGRVNVESVDKEGNKKVVAVANPTAKDRNEAQLHYLKAFRRALENGAILRQKLEDYLKDQKIWDEEKETRYSEIVKDIANGEKKLASGGIKLSEAKEIALNMKDCRNEFRVLVAERTSMDANTAEAQADNASFNYLVYSCTVDPNSGKRIFESLDDYEENADEPFAARAAGTLADKLYQLDPDYEKGLPENKFLVQYKFADEKLRLLNDKGELVDGEGRLLNADGRYVNEDGELVDVDGHLVDEDGEFISNFSPFLDDGGKPVLLEEDKPKRRTRKKTVKEEEPEDEVLNTEEEEEIEAGVETTEVDS
jgi:hypothetical protein